MKKLKRIVFRSFLVLLGLAALLAIGGALFLSFAPQIGGTPEGDRLARMKASGNYQDGVFVNTIETKMGISAADIPKVLWGFLAGGDGLEPNRQILTQTFSPGLYASLPDTQTAVTWFGHSSVLLRTNGQTFLIDPIFSKRASSFSFMGPKRFDFDHHIRVEELPEVHAVLISHDHYDHLDYETMTQLSARVRHFFVPLGVGAHLEAWGIEAARITELNWWEESKFEGTTLALTPARHFSGRALTDQNTTLWGSWAILGKQKVFFTGDSGYTPEFANAGERYGPFDLAFVECGQYNELWSNIHMMPEQTAQAAADLQARWMIPIHWGKFPLALHRWEEPVERMTAEADRLDVNYVLPEINQTFVLDLESPEKRWWEAFL